MEGLPWKIDGAGRRGGWQNRMPDVPGKTGAMARRRVLAEVAVEDDGSFNIAVPADTPIQLQLLDGNGLALRSCAWIWARNHESRGCIGCHEDGELTPEDRFAKALATGSVIVAPGAVRRPAPDFRHDLLPLVRSKCVACHSQGQSQPDLSDRASPVEEARTARWVYEQLLAPGARSDLRSANGKYVQPGKARTSPLVWHVLGRNASRPWDGPSREGPCKPIPDSRTAPLTEADKRAFIEWVDTGAAWDSRAATPEADEQRTPGERGMRERGGM